MTRRRLAGFLSAGLVYLSTVSPASADGLAIPGPGKIELLDLGQIRVTRSVDLKGRGTPILAGHSGGAVMASLLGERLTFWNLPGFTEASSDANSLFTGVVAMEFSATGDRLFLLSSSLKSVLAYSLRTSKIESVYPLPGKEPIGLQVSDDVLLVRQKDGLTVLDTASGALMGQFRLGGTVSGVIYSPNAMTLAVDGRSGLARFRPATAEGLAAVGGTGSYGQLLARPGGGFLAVAISGQSLESWAAPGKLSWKANLAEGPHDLFVTKDQKLILAVGTASRMVSVIEAGTGKELGRLPVEGLAGKAALF